MLFGRSVLNDHDLPRCMWHSDNITGNGRRESLAMSPELPSLVEIDQRRGDRTTESVQPFREFHHHPPLHPGSWARATADDKSNSGSGNRRVGVSWVRGAVPATAVDLLTFC